MMALLGSLKLVPDPEVNMPKVFAGIIIFRVIYFLLPLLFAAAMVGWHEYALRKNWILPVVASPDGQADGTSDGAGVKGHSGSMLADGRPTNGKSGSSEPQRRAP